MKMYFSLQKSTHVLSYNKPVLKMKFVIENFPQPELRDFTLETSMSFM